MPWRTENLIGAINGQNRYFTISYSPSQNTLLVYFSGIAMELVSSQPELMEFAFNYNGLVVELGITPQPGQTPWCRYFYEEGGTPTDFVLPCAPVSFNLIGVQADLLKTSLLNHEPTSYGISGIAATLQKGVMLNQEVGSYGLNGIAATLIRDTILNLEPSSFGITGIAAGLEAGIELIGYWKFDDGSGSIAADSSGNGHTGTINGAAWTTEGKVNGALYFDGIDDSVSVGANPQLDIAGAFTILAWVKPEAILTGYRGLFQNGGNYYLFASDANGLPYGGFYNGSNHQQAISGSALPLGVWTHLVIAFDGSFLRVYRNAIYINNVGTNGTPTPDSYDLFIGATSVGENLQGWADEVRLYRGALSQSDIQTIYDAESVEEAADYYIDGTNGNDTYDGTSPTFLGDLVGPKQTIVAALNLLNSAQGDGANKIIEVLSGTYNEAIDSVDQAFPSGTSWSAPFTLRARAGDTVTIRKTGELNMRIFATYPQYSIVKGFVFDGINLTGAEQFTLGSSTEGGSYVRVQSNQFINNARQMMAIGPLSNHNEILDNIIHGGDFDASGGPGGEYGYCIYLSGTDNLIEGNEFYDFPSWGIHGYNGFDAPLYGHVDNNIVRGNVFHDCCDGLDDRVAAILFYHGTGNQVYNNIIYNSARAGIQVGGGAVDTVIYNNSIYGCVEQGIEAAGTNTAIRNNIVKNCAQAIDITNSINAVVTHNDMHGNTSDTVLQTGATGQTVSDNITTDPLFTDAPNGDFTISGSSPCKNSGVTIALVTNDFIGVVRPQGAEYDIGAYEVI